MQHFNQQEHLAKSPPPSLVPRIHVLKLAKISHSNPALPTPLPDSMGNQAEAAAVRQRLHAMLTQVRQYHENWFGG